MYAKTLEIVLGCLLVLGAWWYSGFTAVESYKKDQEVAQAKATKLQQDKYDELANKYETLRDKRSENARTIIKEVEKIVDRPVYRTNCVDSDGLFYANQALSGQSASRTDANVSSPNTP